MVTPQKINWLHSMVTPQEIEWSHRIENELQFPKGKLVKALIRDRSFMLQDLYDEIYQPESRAKHKRSFNDRR